MTTYNRGDLVQRTITGVYRIDNRLGKTAKALTNRGKFVRYTTKNPSYGSKSAVFDYAYVDWITKTGSVHRMKTALKYIEPRIVRSNDDV